MFYPAVTLMSQFNYSKRFALLAVMSLIAISVVVSSLSVSLNQTIKTLEKETAGIELVENLSKTVQLLQQHRGLSAGLLGGVRSMNDGRAGKEAEILLAVNNLDSKLPAQSNLADEWRNIKADVKKLFAEGLTFNIEQNYTAHTRLIAQLLLFEAEIADDYSLILDTEIDTFYLIDTSIHHLPKALETLGQIRAFGTGILAKKTLSEQDAVTLFSTGRTA